MIVWFSTISVLGIRGIALHPEVLKALSPTYAFDFLFHTGATGFLSLAAVVLAITGVEALYADMGHFGRAGDHAAWLLLVFPACILSYLGQGGLILNDPSTISAPFFQLMPQGGRIPLVVLATAATVIASQAVISGAFSIAQQAAELGYLPRLRVIHTSERQIGQVYVPFVNWVLLVAVLTLVFSFQTSAKLAFAFGMGVTATITITTILFFFIVRHRWHRPLWLAAAGSGGLPGRGPRVLCRQPDQAHPWRLAAAGHRAGPVHGDGHVVPRQPAGDRRAPAYRGAAADIHRRAPR